MKKSKEWLKDEYFKGGDWVPFDMDEAMQKYAKYYASQSQDTITPQMTIAEQQDTIGQLKTQITILLSEVKRLTAEQPTDEDIHFAGKVRYNCDLVPDGESKRRIIDMANIWREGAKAHRDKLIPIKDK